MGLAGGAALRHSTQWRFCLSPAEPEESDTEQSVPGVRSFPGHHFTACCQGGLPEPNPQEAPS